MLAESYLDDVKPEARLDDGEASLVNNGVPSTA